MRARRSRAPRCLRADCGTVGGATITASRSTARVAGYGGELVRPVVVDARVGFFVSQVTRPRMIADRHCKCGEMKRALGIGVDGATNFAIPSKYSCVSEGSPDSMRLFARFLSVKALNGVELILPRFLTKVLCCVFSDNSSAIIAFVATRQLCRSAIRTNTPCGVSVLLVMSVVFRLVRSWLFCNRGFWLHLFVARFWLADVG